ncbi:hypothetical protein DL237_10630 [Pseudooceanicola sediminis]|uniref:DUF3299 domain-containing protein n=1 Tax=Pseudooceanicola sediminis TaxID=2211117 RepID=A0A399J0E5_9RHOB|nr:hypothetical protein [Pseudooceanicola sediminis]KAA2313887.1 hypothetical protein E0K93_12320 [Puniceibacterium sp. HSS470]RII38704.1 hypothetical protein DL237_10630 [Pseudooceanicola sediminis]|tara:strand:- start:5521 stop:5943 length:423 start_codon:yes stop_codon:yes gene_type:complete
MLTRRNLVLAALAVPVASRVWAERAAPMKPRDLYARGGAFTDKARALDGQKVRFEGFMAPPLKADAAFFVLTQRPMAVCPFCESEAEWPDDILAVYIRRRLDVSPFNVRIEASGRLELGRYTDPETGFLSMVRLVDATYG